MRKHAPSIVFAMMGTDTWSWFSSEPGIVEAGKSLQASDHPGAIRLNVQGGSGAPVTEHSERAEQSANTGGTAESDFSVLFIGTVVFLGGEADVSEGLNGYGFCQPRKEGG